MVPNELRAEVIIEAFEKFANVSSPIAKYFTPIGADNGGNVISYEILDYGRAMLDMVAYDAKAPVTESPTRSKVTFECPTYKQRIDITSSLLKQVRDVGSLNPNQQAQIARNVQKLALNLDRRLDWLRAQVLTGGACLTSAGVAPNTTTSGTIYLDSKYLKTSTPQGVSLGFTASHIDSVVGASWATAGTDIKADLDAARLAIMRDSGVDARRVITNSLVAGYLMKNTGSGSRSEFAKAMVDRTGYLPELWGYEFDIIDAYLPFDSESMATDTGGLGVFGMIPGNVVVLTTSDNAQAGRYLIGCEPSDVNAPSGARGAYAWQDGDWQHPHVPEIGIEFTGAPILKNPDSTYIFDDVTSTS